LFPNLKPEYINNTIKKLSTQLNIKGRIVTHSLRKVAPTYEMKTTGDIRKGMQQTGHKSVQVFMDCYTDKDTVEFSGMAGVRMFKPVQEDVFDGFSKEDILSMLEKINPTAYHQLNLQMAKIQGGK